VAQQYFSVVVGARFASILWVGRRCFCVSAPQGKETRVAIEADNKPVVLMTGSSGLIGTCLAEALADRYRVVGLDVKSPEGEPPLDFLECDLTAGESVAHALQRAALAYGDRIASVIHLAAYYDFSGEPSPLYEELTVKGTQRLLEQLRAKFATVEQFVFSSSLLVMKPADSEEPLTESSPTQAEWDYPESKLEAERVIDQSAGDIPVVVLRIAGVYDDRCHSIPIAQHIARIYERQLESYFFPGRRDAGQSFIHLDDLAGCMRQVVDKRRELDSREIFLIGEEDVMSYAELQDQLGELIHGHEWPTLRIPKVAAKAGAWVQEKLASGEEEKPFIKPWMIDLADQDYRIDISHARDRLNWSPRRTLRESLENMVEFLDRDPEAWYRENKIPLPQNLEQLKHEDD
jgi:nucleoside-diphosphate-sugar epimerase